MKEDIDVIATLKMLFGEPEIRKGSRLVASLYDHTFEVMDWAEKLPYMEFPAHWQVKITPAFMSSIIRFRVKFDGYNNLGCCSEPYWEIYPNSEGDNARFGLGEEKEMFKEIEKALERLERDDPT